MTVKKSPFPGMDPWLETKWPEVHASLIVYSRNQLNRQLPDDLRANIEENPTVRFVRDEPVEDRSQRIRPDINIAREPSVEYQAVSGTNDVSGVVIATPKIFSLPTHPQRHLEIASREGKVITAIEFVSPWNKIGTRNREAYALKQSAYIAAGINLVEIDLVRQGQHGLLAPPEGMQNNTWESYGASIYRIACPEEVAWFPMPLTETLPNLPIPLRTDEPDIVLQLQPLIDECYRDGRYYPLDYATQPPPTFSESQQAWVIKRLQSQTVNLKK